MTARMRTETMQRRHTWLRRTMPRPFDWVTTIFYLSALAVHFYFRAKAVCDACFWGGSGALLVAGAIALLLAVDRIEYWRFGEIPPRPVAAGFLIARALLIGLISVIDEFNFSMFLYILLPFMAFPVFGSRVSYTIAAAAWLVYLGKITSYPDWTRDEHEIVFFIVYTAGLIFVVTMAHVVSNERTSRARAEELLEELQASHRRLQEYADQVAELAATEERNRLARDIHDSLGHYLTVINVQLEKALAFRRPDPAEADQAVVHAKRLASEALQDIRRSVGALRETEEGFSLSAAIEELVAHLPDDRLQVELTIRGDERDFPRQSLHALFRATQEGLTNVQKHAAAGQARLHLVFDQQAATLHLSDDGVGFDLARLHGPAEVGFGLPGIRERLELVQGQMQVESRPGAGTTLVVSVPRVPLTSIGPVPGHGVSEPVLAETNRHGR